MSSPRRLRSAPWILVGAVGCTFPDVTIIEGTTGATTTGGGQGTGASPSTGGVGAGASGAQGGTGNQTGGAAGGGGEGGVPCTSGNRCDCDGDGEDAESCGGMDCDDDDADVFSTQTDWFDEPRDSGGYDYDCSGMEERLHPTFVCSAALGLCANTDPGFLVDTRAQNPVACGAVGSYGTCVVLSCKNVTNPALQQECH